MKLHGPLATERVAVRRYANAGEGFRETHGLHGNMDKLYYAVAQWGHQALLTGIQKVSDKIRASVRFTAIPCPACISGERHAVRWSALPSDVCRRATVRAGHHSTTGSVQIPQRAAVWVTSAGSSLRPVRPQSRNLLKPYTKVNHGLKDKQCTKEINPQ